MAFIPTENLILQRYQTDNPTVQRVMVNDNATLSHHLSRVAQAQGISPIPAITLCDDIEG